MPTKPGKTCLVSCQLVKEDTLFLQDLLAKKLYNAVAISIVFLTYNTLQKIIKAEDKRHMASKTKISLCETGKFIQIKTNN